MKKLNLNREMVSVNHSKETNRVIFLLCGMFLLVLGLASTVFTSCGNEQAPPPPIENTTGYANANVLLPKKWNGTAILANGFVWIWENDKKLQDKYNVHPGDDYGFYDDHEIWDDDETYYKYPLSPNVVIEAGVLSELSKRRMTVNEFGEYMRSMGFVEGAYGIVANVTYENEMITKIVEVYTP